MVRELGQGDTTERINTNWQIVTQATREGDGFYYDRLLTIAADGVVIWLIKSIDSNHRSAASLIFSTYTGLRSINAMFLYDTSMRVRAAANSSPRTKGNIARKSLLLSTFLSGIGMIVAYTSPYTLSWTRQPSEIINITQRFLYAYAPALPFTLGAIAMQHTFLGLGKPTIIFKLGLSPNLLLVALAYLLMFKANLDETGLGIAYTASSFLHFCLYLIYLKINAGSNEFHPYDFFNFRNFFKLDKDFWDLLRNGGWIGGYALSELGSVIFSTLLINQYGEDDATTSLPALKIGSFLANSSFTLAFILSNLGREKMRDNQFLTVRKIGNLGALIGLSAPIVALALFFVPECQQFIVELYIGSNIPEWMKTQASQFLLTNLVIEVLDAIRSNSVRMLCSLDITGLPAIINFLSVLLINLPAALLARFYFNYGAVSILIARGISIGVSTALNTGLWYRAIGRQSPRTEAIPLLSHIESPNPAEIVEDNEEKTNYGCLNRFYTRVLAWWNRPSSCCAENRQEHENGFTLSS